jgi:hypothetical protein
MLIRLLAAQAGLPRTTVPAATVAVAVAAMKPRLFSIFVFP